MMSEMMDDDDGVMKQPMAPKAEEKPPTPPPEPDLTYFQMCQRGKFDDIKRKHEAGQVDIHERDDENISGLHWAAINGKTDLVTYLCEQGCEIDVKGGELMGTPLQWAVRYGHMETVVAMLNQGADPNVTDNQTFNALHLAAQFGFPYICAYLVAKGVNVDSGDAEGQTALMWATIKLAGQNVTDVMRVLIGLGAALNHQCTARGNTALHCAVNTKNEFAGRILVENGADSEISNNSNETPKQLLKQSINQLMGAQQAGTIDKMSGQMEMRSLVTLHKTLPYEPTSCWPGIVQQHGNRHLIQLMLPYMGLCAIGLSFETMKVDIFKGAAMLVAVFVIWMQLLQLVSYKQPSNDVRVPGAMAVYLGTKMMFFTFFFWELLPYTQGEEAIVGYTWTFSAVFFSCAVWYNWLSCHRGDPGILVKAKDSTGWEREIIKLAEKNLLMKETFCVSCGIRKPYRSKHDSFTNVCVSRFDHYCPFVGNVVGGDNHRYFMGFVLSLPPLLITYGILVGRYYAEVCPAPDGFFDTIIVYATCKPFATFTMMCAGLHSFWVTGLATAQMHQVANDLTTNEAMNKYRYPYLAGGSPWDKGCMRNIVEFFRSSSSYDWKTVYTLPGDKVMV